MEETTQVGRYEVSLGTGGVLLAHSDASSLTLSPAEALELLSFLDSRKEALSEMLLANSCAYCSTHTGQLYICIECGKIVCIDCSENAPPTPNTPLASERICRECVDV